MYSFRDDGQRRKYKCEEEETRREKNELRLCFMFHASNEQKTKACIWVDLIDFYGKGVCIALHWNYEGRIESRYILETAPQQHVGNPTILHCLPLCAL